MPIGSLKIRTQWAVFAGLRDEPNLYVRRRFGKNEANRRFNRLAQKAFREFENTNPMGGFRIREDKEREVVDSAPPGIRANNQVFK
jgi:hypothetical protein